MTSTNLQEWEKEFDSLVELNTKQTGEVLDIAAHTLHSVIVERTPVGDPSLWKWPAHKDYTPGTLKAAWTIDETSYGYEIKNTTPYAYRVEYGYSTQAPDGMMRTSALDWGYIVDKASKAVFK